MATATADTNVRLYCTCGASGVGTISPPAKAEKFRRLWSTLHSGPVHTPCDQKTAARARRKADVSVDE
jgi:hypothetical protein